MVTTIIALLAALLFPVLGAARRSSQRAVCTSHLRELVAAWAMYQEDYGAPPPSLYASREDPGLITWHLVTWQDLLLPYAGSEALFVCPAHAEALAQGGSYEYPMGILANDNNHTYGKEAESDTLHESSLAWARAHRRHGVVFICPHHESRGVPMALVAYQDGSVKWGPLPEWDCRSRPSQASTPETASPTWSPARP